MPFRVAVFANLSEDCICISGTPLKYCWNIELESVRLSQRSDAIAIIDPKDLTCIYILLEQKSVRVEAESRPLAENFTFTLQEDFWGKFSIRLFRRTSRSKNYNDKQPWIATVIPPNSKLGYQNNVLPEVIYITI